MRSDCGLGAESKEDIEYHTCFRGYADINMGVKDKCNGQPLLSHSSQLLISWITQSLDLRGMSFLGFLYS